MMMVMMVEVMPMTFAMAVVLVAIAVAVAPMMMVTGPVVDLVIDAMMASAPAVQVTGNVCNDVKRPDVAVASVTDDSVGQEKRTHADCDYAAIGLGWCCGACGH